MASNALDELRESLAYERSTWAETSVAEQEFYTAPPNSSEKPPGSLLKLEKHVDTSKYLLPSTTALSRFIYQSQTLMGRKVPVSAYILWPYAPRTLSDGFAVAAWAHGTSGFHSNAAPSHLKNLWQNFQAPYHLALQGYVVVATDYAGLGLIKDSLGREIVLEYLSTPSQAKDVMNAVKAAQEGFPELSKRFVSVGQSQGGGAVWSLAHLSALQDIPGYLGGVAISPYVGLLDNKAEVTEILAALTVPGVAAIWSDFRSEDVLTPEGQRQLDLVHSVNPLITSAFTMLSGIQLFKQDWKQNDRLREYQKMTSNGGKPIGSPLFVAHGLADPILDSDPIINAAEESAAMDPRFSIELYLLSDVAHVSAIPASQHLWMDWIAARFANKQVQPECHTHQIKSVQPAGAHQKDQNWYLKQATKPWHAPGP